jgi:BRCA1-associated protein
MFISSQEKVRELQAQGEDVMEGSVSVPEPSKKGKGKGRKK